LSSDSQLYQPYIPSSHNFGWQGKAASTPQGLYGEDEMSPFGMSYANLAGVEMSNSYSGGYQEHSMIPVRPTYNASPRYNSAPSYRYHSGADGPT